ncbi:uncharacterized protein [Triticum aestivum]|nr:uncharacterized protein LOC123188804 isoform X2 [Triticum aestivum]
MPTSSSSPTAAATNAVDLHHRHLPASPSSSTASSGDKLVGEGEVPGSETKGSPNRTFRRDSKRGAKQEPCGTDNDGDGEDDDVSQRVSK